MKSKILGRLLAIGLSVGAVLPVAMIATTANAFTTVYDPSVFARQLEQLNNAKQQLDQAKQMYSQFQGTRNLGALFNQYGKYMPSDMQAMYQQYQSGNWTGLADKVAALQNSQQLTGTQKQMLDQIANRSKMSALNNSAKLNDMYAQSNARFAQIQRMANSVDLQKDPKAAADLLNRIQVESAMLQLQTNQLQMVNMMRQSEKDLEQQQAMEQQRKFNSSQNTTRRASVRAFQ